MEDELDRFHGEVWPEYKRRGYTKDTALIAWMLDRLLDRVDRIDDNIIAMRDHR